MPFAAESYEATPLWVADVILKGNRLLGTAPGACETAQQREWHAAYNRWLVQMASGGGAAAADRDSPQDQAMVCHTIASLSALRRATGQRMRAATDPLTKATNDLHSFAAKDWLLAASGQDPDALALGSAQREHETAERGMGRLRALLTDLSVAYMDAEPSERAERAIETLMSEATARIVRNALTMQAVVGLFDSARLATGARINLAVFGEGGAPLCADVPRAEAGRADAYAAMRLYAGLQTIVALMMMGASRRYEGTDGHRGRWAEKPLGRAVLGYREEVARALQAYDGTKRRSAVEAGHVYKAQTPGYVAALQEQAATLAMRAHYEEHDEGLHEALICALSEPGMFDVCLPGGARVARCTFWQAVREVSEARTDAWTGRADQRVAPLCAAMQQVWSAFLFGVGEPEPSAGAEAAPPPLVAPTPAMCKAMRQAMESAPPVANFYGRDFAETERKVIARAAKEGRDPQGREAGEAFGYRLEWMGLLSGERAVRPPVASTGESTARVRGAITAMAMSEAFATAGGGSRALPIASGNAIHYVHTVAAAKEPTQLRLVWVAGRNPAHPHLLDKGDPKNAGAVAADRRRHRGAKGRPAVATSCT